MNMYDLLLKKNITQFNINKDHYNNLNKLPLIIPIDVKLLLVSDNYISMKCPLLIDIIYSMHLTIKQLFFLTKNQLFFLPYNLNYNIWWIGTKVVCNFRGLSLITPSLENIKNSKEIKFKLWEQIKIYNKISYSLNKLKK